MNCVYGEYASIDDCIEVVEKVLKTYSPEGQKYLYVIEMKLLKGVFLDVLRIR
jgi:hypothetical protein